MPDVVQIMAAETGEASCVRNALLKYFWCFVLGKARSASIVSEWPEIPVDYSLFFPALHQFAQAWASFLPVPSLVISIESCSRAYVQLRASYATDWKQYNMSLRWTAFGQIFQREALAEHSNTSSPNIRSTTARWMGEWENMRTSKICYLRLPPDPQIVCGAFRDQQYANVCYILLYDLLHLSPSNIVLVAMPTRTVLKLGRQDVPHIPTYSNFGYNIYVCVLGPLWFCSCVLFQLCLQLESCPDFPTSCSFDLTTVCREPGLWNRNRSLRRARNSSIESSCSSLQHDFSILYIFNHFQPFHFQPKFMSLLGIVCCYAATAWIPIA